MSSGTGRKRIALGVALFATFAAVGPAALAAGKIARDSRHQFQPARCAQRLNEILGTIRSSNAPSLIGAGSWTRLVAQHREAIEASRTHAAFATEVNRLIAAAGISHFHYYIDEDWDYWHLQSTFGDGKRSDKVAHIGIVPQRIDGRWFVRGILEGSVAVGSDLRVGDELLTVDGVPYTPIDALHGTEGRSTVIRVRRRPGLVLHVTIKPVRGSLYRAMQRAMQESIGVVEYNGLRFAYLHGWTMLGSAKEYRTLAKMEDDVDGLLLDYRDGYGGTWSRAERFLVGKTGHQFDSGSDRIWDKPVVILTGDGTRSAKEIVVDAVKRAKRAPLIGEATPGHVISVGGVVSIGDDAMLMLPGHRFSLEGKPTLPDYPMAREIRYSAGADPQMRLAKEILATLIRERKGRRTRGTAPAGEAVRGQ
jgi:carboxyl-terminal processing protease